jgi:hypothetical protein
MKRGINSPTKGPKFLGFRLLSVRLGLVQVSRAPSAGQHREHTFFIGAVTARVAGTET